MRIVAAEGSPIPRLEGKNCLVIGLSSVWVLAESTGVLCLLAAKTAPVQADSEDAASVGHT
jgi:hypothetical protein